MLGYIFESFFGAIPIFLVNVSFNSKKKVSSLQFQSTKKRTIENSVHIKATTEEKVDIEHKKYKHLHQIGGNMRQKKQLLWLK